MSDPAATPAVVISYARVDAPAVLPYLRLLEREGIHCWIDHEDIDGAELWAAEIAEAIDDCQVVVFFVSPRSVESISVQRELALAFEGKKRILPLLLEPAQLPAAMRYQLAGVQHVELYGPTADPEARLPAILRGLDMFGITPSTPTGSVPVVAAADLERHMWEQEAAPAPVPAPTRLLSQPGTRRRLVAIAAAIVVLVGGIVVRNLLDDDGSNVSTDQADDEAPIDDEDLAAPTNDGGAAGDPDGSPATEADCSKGPPQVPGGESRAATIVDGDHHLYLTLANPTAMPIHLRSGPSAGADPVGDALPHGTGGLVATGDREGGWVKVTRDGPFGAPGTTGWVDAALLTPAAPVDDHDGFIRDMGYTPSVEPHFNEFGLGGIHAVQATCTDPTLGHLEVVFCFDLDRFLGVDGFPSRRIGYIDPDPGDRGFTIGYVTFTGPGARVTVPHDDPTHEYAYLHCRDGMAFYDPESLPPGLDPAVAAAFGVPEQGTDFDHR